MRKWAPSLDVVKTSSILLTPYGQVLDARHVPGPRPPALPGAAGADGAAPVLRPGLRHILHCTNIYREYNYLY